MKKKQFWRYNEVTTDTVQTANCTPNWANEQLAVTPETSCPQYVLDVLSMDLSHILHLLNMFYLILH